MSNHLTGGSEGTDVTELFDAAASSGPATDGSARTPLAPALHALERTASLDPLVEAGNGLSGALTATPLVKAALQGSWLGHALHPLVIEVPMGTWLSAAVLDAVGGRAGRESATLLTGVGILAAVPAAVTGWAEFAEAGPRSKRVAVVHAGANAAGLGLQIASYAARRSGHHGAGAALSAGAMTLVGAAGYLGGHLAAARKVGTHDPSFGPETPGAARA